MGHNTDLSLHGTYVNDVTARGEAEITKSRVEDHKKRINEDTDAVSEAAQNLEKESITSDAQYRRVYTDEDFERCPYHFRTEQILGSFPLGPYHFYAAPNIILPFGQARLEVMNEQPAMVLLAEAVSGYQKLWWSPIKIFVLYKNAREQVANVFEKIGYFLEKTHGTRFKDAYIKDTPIKLFIRYYDSEEELRQNKDSHIKALVSIYFNGNY